MKKSLMLFIGLTLIILLILPALALPEISILIGDQPLICDVPPIIIEGRTLVPLRAIFEGLGMTVDYQSATKMITGTSADRQIKLQVNSVNAAVRDLASDHTSFIVLDVPAQIINGRTMVPVRFIGESAGAIVNWDPIERSVGITPSDEIGPPDIHEVNLPPEPLADPVQFTTLELTDLIVNTSDLATDRNGTPLEIVSITETSLVDIGDQVIAVDDLSFRFHSIDITGMQDQTLIVTVTDGVLEADVNVTITVSDPLAQNLAPVVQSPYSYEISEQDLLMVNILDFASDLNGDVVTLGPVIVVGPDYTASIDPIHGQQFAFRSTDISTTVTQELAVTVTDGILDTTATIYIHITPKTTINIAPVALEEPVVFAMLSEGELTVRVDQLALDYNSDDLTLVSAVSATTPSHGRIEMKQNLFAFDFIADAVTATTEQKITATLTDGAAEITVTAAIYIYPRSSGAPSLMTHVVPITAGRAYGTTQEIVTFAVAEQTDLIVDSQSLAWSIAADPMLISGLLTDSSELNYGNLQVSTAGFTYHSSDVSACETEIFALELSNATYHIEVPIRIIIIPQGLTEPLAMTPLGNPLELEIDEQTDYILTLPELLAGSTSGMLIDRFLPIVQPNVLAGTIATNQQSILLRSADISADESGYYAFWVTDGGHHRAVLAHITIRKTSQLPIAIADPVAFTYTSTTYNLIGADELATDPDGDTLTVTRVQIAPFSFNIGTFDVYNHVLRYQSNDRYGAANLTVTVSDGINEVDINVKVTHMMTMVPYNAPPTAIENLTFNVYHTSDLLIDVHSLAIDTHQDLMITGFSGVDHGTMIVSGNMGNGGPTNYILYLPQIPSYNASFTETIVDEVIIKVTDGTSIIDVPATINILPTAQYISSVITVSSPLVFYLNEGECITLAGIGIASDISEFEDHTYDFSWPQLQYGTYTTDSFSSEYNMLMYETSGTYDYAFYRKYTASTSGSGSRTESFSLELYEGGILVFSAPIVIHITD